jgi:hypothetical protein
MMLMLLLHPDHTMDQNWSVHAEIHLRQAIIFAGGFCVMGLVMSWWWLRSRQRWVRWALCLNAACLFGGYGAPPLLLSQEPFSPFDVWGMSGLAAVNVLGLILVFSRLASVPPGIRAERMVRRPPFKCFRVMCRLTSLQPHSGPDIHGD